MNKTIERILEEIDHNIQCVPIDFYDSTWRKDIPSEAGWYIIKTNVPIEVLREVKSPLQEQKAHINIPATVNNTARLHGITIT